MNPLSTRPNRWRPITVFNLLVGLIFSLSALAQPAFLKEGLVAYYPFNGNANDESGNKYTGTETGLTYTADRFSRNGSSPLFNGVSSVVHLPINNWAAPEYSINCWVKGLYSENSEDLKGLVYSRPEGTDNINGLCFSPTGPWGPGFRADASSLEAWNLDHSTARNGNWWWAQIGNQPTLLDNNWIMITAVYKFNTKSPTIEIYHNGILIETSPAPKNPIGQITLSSLRIGADHISRRTFKGNIDDVRLYARALDASQVKALYDYEATPPDNSFITNGLVAYYPFNGNANDESGNNRNGQVSLGGPILTSNRFGQPNCAYYFSGSNGGITVPDSLHPTGLNPDLTGVFWIKSPYSDTLRVAVGVGSYTTGSASACGITINGILLYSVHNGENYFTNKQYQPQTWTQLAYTKVGRTVSIYLNGEKVGSATAPSTYLTSKNLFIGWNGNFGLGNGQQWVGAIDDLRIYNRALTDNDVKSLYDYESTPPDNSFITNGLVAYYPFNGNANDESGNGNHLKTSGLPKYEKPNRNGNVNSSVDLSGGANYFTLDDKNFSGNLIKSPFTIVYWRKGDGSDGAVCVEDSGSVLWSVGGKGDVIGADENVGLTGERVGFGFRTGLSGSEWNCVSIVWNGNSSKAYSNGKAIGYGYLPPLSTARDTHRLYIGADPYAGFEYYNGQVDDIRIYNRALSDGEVKALYDYESTPNPRIASATAQVVNGFVVGGTITDGGYGYVSNPVVTITGGGGTGAKATALQVDGVVTSITITNPGSGYTSTPYITIAPPPFPPRKATSSAQIVNGFVVGTKITDSGFGYDSPPAVLIVGGDGSGATAVATVANGVVTTITITNPGTGYTSVPIVRIASPPFAPKLGIETSKVYVRMSVVLGRKYQLEASTDLNTWTSTGPAFIAQDEELAQEFDVNRVGRYFRINQVP